MSLDVLGNCVDQLQASPFFQKQGLSSSNGAYSSNSLPHLHHINHHNHHLQQQQQYQKPQIVQKESFARTSGTSSNGSTTTTSKASSNLSDEGIQLPDLISPAKPNSSSNNGMHGIKTNGSLSVKEMFSRTPASEPSVPSYAPPSVPKEEAPPIIPERPTKTMSIYTKPKEEEVIKDLSNGGFGRNAARAKRRVTDIEVLAKLKTIVTIGNPDRKYHKVEKIGSGASGSVWSAIEVNTGAEVAIKQMNLSQQPKKELIINEILVMRENKQ